MSDIPEAPCKAAGQSLQLGVENIRTFIQMMVRSLSGSNSMVFLCTAVFYFMYLSTHMSLNSKTLCGQLFIFGYNCLSLKQPG